MPPNEIQSEEEINARWTCAELLNGLGLKGLAQFPRYGNGYRKLSVRKIFFCLLKDFHYSDEERKILEMGLDIAEQGEI